MSSFHDESQLSNVDNDLPVMNETNDLISFTDQDYDLGLVAREMTPNPLDVPEIGNPDRVRDDVNYSNLDLLALMATVANPVWEDPFQVPGVSQRGRIQRKKKTHDV